jgi:hypothetical protein
MLRLLTSFPVVVILLALAGLYYIYGELDPCRMLAVERARRAETTSSGITERLSQQQISHMSMGACARGLYESWRERLTG